MYYNPLDKFYKSNTGAICAHDVVTFRVKGFFDSVVLLYRKDGDESVCCLQMERKQDFFECNLCFDTGLYFYSFKRARGRR